MVAAGRPSAAATPPTLSLKVLLIGSGSADPTTGAWEAALSSEGVAYTEVTAAGTAPSETVSLPALSSGTTGNFNGVVIADDPADFASGQLSALDNYESAFGVRQVDGYTFPTPTLGQTFVSSGALDGTTGTLTSAGLAAFPELKGPVPFDAGTFGYWSTTNSGAPFTPLITNSAGDALAGVYQHPSTDPQAGVAELALNFDYNASLLQWLLLAPGLINWVTQDVHLGLYRNYFGEDIDDTFINDNEWSSTFQCTPAATDPPDFTCPPADQGVAPGSAPGVPADVQMSAADVAYVTNWEQQTGIKLNLVFNAQGACTAPAAADETSANCGGSVTDNGTTYTDPGQVVDSTFPNDQGLVNALLASQASFNWINHTWSHLFLGCTQWQPQPFTSVTGGAGGTMGAGTYSYEITAATAYGESEPSAPRQVTVASGGSATLTWPDAPNGTADNGTTPGPSLAALKSEFSGGSGFWGYDIYRENPGSSTYGLVGQVPETSGSSYTFTDSGSATPGGSPGSGPTFPTATDPGIDCSSAAGSWLPASSTTPDSSIEQEIGLNQAFAAANGLASFDSHDVVTGEHSGLENPNMPTALQAVGITTFAEDGSRQSQQYSLGGAQGAPRYPSNIYYNASNWTDQLNEYNTLYVQQGDSIGNGDVGRCVNSGSTTCRTTPATEADVLAAESRIMLGHVLDNNPRVGYAHQSNLIGPATQNGQDYGYTILDLISSMQSQYDGWYNAATTPLDQMTDSTEAQMLAEQGAWAQAAGGGNYTASETNDIVTITNNGAAVSVPVTMPSGTTVNGSAFGQAYGGQRSAWVTIAANGTTTLTQNVAPAITSATSATSTVGAAFSFTVTTTGAPAPALTESGALPAGLTFKGNGDGTATISGTPAAGSGGSYPITITATNAAGSATQNLTLTNTEAPAITSPGTATFTTGIAGTYTITTTGYPKPSITEAGTLPAGLTFKDNGTGTGTISGTPASGSAGSYPVTVSAANSAGSTATLQLTITVKASTAPTITSGSTANLTVNQAGSVSITTTGSPTPKITASGVLPAGLTFTDNGNGTATIAGTATSTGTHNLTITASNGTTPDATQAFTLVVGQAPAFTSPSSVSLAVGTTGTFRVTTSGYPAAGLTGSNVPPGMTFTSNGDGTATLSGTPTTPGTYTMALAAVNAYGTAQQTLTVTVQQAPAITSGASTTFTVGKAGTFTVTTTGAPTATIAAASSPALPSGVTFKDNGNGTATLSGTPASGSQGTYALTITASNAAGTVSQSFRLAVSNTIAFISGATVTETAGTPFSYTVATTGYPAPGITATGLPAGVSFSDNRDGTGTLSGTSAVSTGTYSVTVTDSNGGGSVSQTITLSVKAKGGGILGGVATPAFTSPATATISGGLLFSFTATTTGYPTVPLLNTVNMSVQGTLPAPIVVTNNLDGSLTFLGTPLLTQTGTYRVTLTASNSAGTVTQSFLLTVTAPPTVTTPSSATATVGAPFSFMVQTTGTPTPALAESGALPPGLTWKDNGDGTATLAGAPTTAGSYALNITASNSVGTDTQQFTLTVQ